MNNSDEFYQTLLFVQKKPKQTNKQTDKQKTATTVKSFGFKLHKIKPGDQRTTRVHKR